MKPSSLSIGVVAKQADCTVPTIRYYEEIGLLPPAPRTGAGQRLYGEATVRRLLFVRRCRDFGFSIDQVRELVSLVDQPNRPCVEVRDIAAVHLEAVRGKLEQMKALEASLLAFVGSCDRACAGGPSIDCTILEDLAMPKEKPQALGEPGCCAG